MSADSDENFLEEVKAAALNRASVQVAELRVKVAKLEDALRAETRKNLSMEATNMCLRREANEVAAGAIALQRELELTREELDGERERRLAAERDLALATTPDVLPKMRFGGRVNG